MAEARSGVLVNVDFQACPDAIVIADFVAPRASRKQIVQSFDLGQGSLQLSECALQIAPRSLLLGYIHRVPDHVGQVAALAHNHVSVEPDIS